GEFEHRRLKQFYARTNKGHTFELQLSRHKRRERAIRRIAKEVEKSKKPVDKANPAVPLAEVDPLSPTSPRLHHETSNKKFARLNIFQWLHKNKDDPSLLDFIPKLKDHLLSRLLHGTSNQAAAFTLEQQNSVHIENDSLFCHKVLRINYTTYDLRRSQDSVNPRTHPDVMTL
ncbi:hypothetical protein CPC08DRAFT_613770, partial [Agrocybe pediades]